MSENNRDPLSSQEELLRRLKSIGIDLWGNGPGPEAKQAAAEAVERDFAAAAEETQLAGQDMAERNPKPAAGTAAPERLQKPATGIAAPEKKLTLDNLWITADETVDWTEALLQTSPRDGLTSPKLWSFYHRMAPQVLEGKTEAYAEVLKALNPVGDLAPFVTAMVLRTPGPDLVECVFDCQRDDLAQRGRDYLGALSLRIARDLLALLPVSQVRVTGNLDGTEKVNVLFHREQLLKQKMAFLNPADFVESCGGKFTLD